MITQPAAVISLINHHAEQKLSTFVLAKFRFTAQWLDSVRLPAFSGSIFHGGFGFALKTISPLTFQYLFQPQFSGDPPKPYVVVPPQNENKIYQAGDSFQFELTLIGPAAQHFPICFAAFEKLGELGVGKQRAKFNITQVHFFNEESTPKTIYENRQWQFVDCYVSGESFASSAQQTCNQLTLTFPNNLRLKNNAKLVTQTPSFCLLMDRLLGRLCTLSKFYGKDSKIILHKEERSKLLSQAETVTTFYHNMNWQEWTRYSSRQKTEMIFGGLTGIVQYRGELTPFLLYFKLGQWLHIGSKTSFGLGGYEMEVG